MVNFWNLKIARKDLEHHERTQIQKHLKLLSERILKIQQTQGSALTSCAESPPAATPSAGGTLTLTEGESSGTDNLSESESLPPPSGEQGSPLTRAEDIRQLTSLGAVFSAFYVSNKL